jgi:DeoR/GlpR family transcriptional regulator of sugar metabolism
MFECAERRILLADHTKFERRALHAMCALNEFDVIVVDDGTPPRQVEEMKAGGMTVVVAAVRQENVIAG